ncbi:MAG: serine/threonine protein kinase [Labilithrix sp.]|nr:serine/threonine protein kinase [Labilithrix sp.]MCW5815181.1 serine/threonine protein kinase [Labilithrix sp.]
MANPEDLGRYRLKRLLGRGVLGEVWEASDLEHEGHKVAVKILHAADDELALARLQFAREARLCAQLSHPNLAQVLDAGEAAGTSFMVMEMIEGKPLRQLVGDASVTMHDKLRWLRQIGGALAVLHRADVAHRDLKPENVLIRPDGTACLVDLGIAKWTRFDLGGERDPLEAIEAMEPKEGPDPRYAPPEALESETYDELGDQWAWGTLGYELLTGKAPGPDSKPLAAFDEVSAPVADALDKARSPKREDRFDGIELALDEIGPGSAPAIPAAPPKKAPSSEPPSPSTQPAPAAPLSRRDVPPPSIQPQPHKSPLIMGLGLIVVIGVLVAIIASMR